MSLSLENLDIYKVLDPTLNFENKRCFTVERGSQENFYYPFPASGTTSTSVNTIVANPSSRGTMMSRKVYLRATFIVTLNSNGAGTNLNIYVPGVSGAPRAYPISSCLKNLQCNIGNDSVTTQLNTYFGALQRYANPHELQNGEHSVAPVMSDTNQSFGLSTDGINNPLADYGSGIGPVTIPRGGFVLDSITPVSTTAVPVAGAKTQQVLTFTVTEPLYISPMIQQGEASAFIGIEQFQVVTTFDNLSARLWTNLPPGIAGGQFNDITSIGVTLPAQGLSLLVRQLTPPINMHIPMPLTYSYQTVTPYESAFTVMTPKTSLANSPDSVAFNSGSITVNTIPERILVWVGNSSADLSTALPTAGLPSTTALTANQHNAGWYIPDTYATITKITVQWNTRQLLASATKEDLYEIAKRSGCTLSYPQWVQYTGSVLAVDFPSTIGLDALSAPGVLSRNQLQITLQAYLPPAYCNGYVSTGPGDKFFNFSKNMSLYVAIIETGSVSILENGHVVKNVGLLTESDVLAAETSMKSLPFRPERDMWGGKKTSRGGDFFGDLWSGIKDTGKWVADNIGPITTVASKLMGGRRKSHRSHRSKGGRKKSHRSRSHSRGRGVVGGRRIHR